MCLIDKVRDAVSVRAEALDCKLLFSLLMEQLLTSDSLV